MLLLIMTIFLDWLMVIIVCIAFIFASACVSSIWIFLLPTVLYHNNVVNMSSVNIKDAYNKLFPQRPHKLLSIICQSAYLVLLSIYGNSIEDNLLTGCMQESPQSNCYLHLRMPTRNITVKLAVNGNSLTQWDCHKGDITCFVFGALTRKN